MGERSGGLEARNARNYRVRSDVEENLVARQYACPAVIQAHLERFRCHKTPSPHNQFGPARLVVLQMEVNFAINHVALALANLCHVGRDGTGRCTELCGAMRQMCDPRAPNLILAGQAMLGQEPPIHRRSTTAVRRPDRAICQASNLPPCPLPRTRASTRSG